MRKMMNVSPSALTISVAMVLAGAGINSAAALETNTLVGLSATYNSEEFVGVDSETEPSPILYYQVGRFAFFPLGVSAELITFDFPSGGESYREEQFSPYSLTFSATAQYADDERDNDDSDIFTGMDEREVGTTAGLTAALSSPVGAFEMSFQTDISGASDGTVGSVAYAVPLMDHHQFSLSGNLGVAISDENWNDYYYGVRTSEATADRSAYSASSSVNPFIGINASYAINRQWVVTHTTSVTQLDNTLVDSPLTTDDESHTEVSIGVLYSF